MRKLNLAAVTDSAQYRVKKGTLNFMQDAYTEMVKQIVTSLVGFTYVPYAMYVLQGLRRTGYPSYIIEAGTVLYQDELFAVDAASFTPTGTDTAVVVLETSQYTTNADPVTLTNLSVVNLHDIRKMKVQAGASGSGLVDFQTVIYLDLHIPAQLILEPALYSPYGDNILQVLGSYPNLKLYVPPPANNAYPTLLAGHVNVGDFANTTDVGVSFAALSTANYAVLVSIVSQGDPTTDSHVTWSVRGKTTTGFTIRFGEAAGITQNISFDYVLVKVS